MGVSTSSFYYYVHDHLYSPVALIDLTGNVVERYEYDAYGKAHVYNGDFSQSYSASQVGNPYLFTGRRLDFLDWNSGTSEYDLNIMYYRNRYYDPATGRFLQHDPLGATVRIILRESRSPWVFGTTGPPEDSSKYSKLLRVYLTIAYLEDLNISIQGIKEYTRRQYFEYPQYVDGLNIYQYVLSNPLILIDPYGLITLDDLIEWNPDKFYNDRECYAYCIMQALGVSQDLIDRFKDEAIDQIVDELIKEIAKNPLRVIANQAELGICEGLCTGGLKGGDPWNECEGGIGAVNIPFVIWCALLVCLNSYIIDRRSNAKN